MPQFLSFKLCAIILCIITHLLANCEDVSTMQYCRSLVGALYANWRSIKPFIALKSLHKTIKGNRDISWHLYEHSIEPQKNSFLGIKFRTRSDNQRIEIPFVLLHVSKSYNKFSDSDQSEMWEKLKFWNYLETDASLGIEKYKNDKKNPSSVLSKTYFPCLFIVKCKSQQWKEDSTAKRRKLSAKE